MDIRDVIQEAINRHPERVKLFSQIKVIRSIADDRERTSFAITFGKAWFIKAMESNDPQLWASCMSAMYCVGAAAWEIHDKKEALHWARGEAVAQGWDGDWDKAEIIWHSVH
jgi:hypothetical protein